MRIAIVSNTAWYLFNFRLNLIRALQREGHEVVAVAPEDEYSDRLRNAGVSVEGVAISGGGTNPVTELRSVMALRRVFRRKGVDVVFSYTPKGNLYSALACISADISFVPNVSGLGRAFIRQSPLTRIVQALYKFTFRRAGRIFFQNNDDMALFVQQGLALADKCERLPGSGVDLHRFLPLPPPLHDEGAPVFLLVARMLWDKGVGEYVEAARQIKKEYPAARWQLLGFADVANPSAISKAQIEQWCAEGVVEYLGPTDDVRPFLAAADCVVLPSYREGVPRTLLEAAAHGRPVITTDAPGCRDTVVPGRTGLLCRVADASDLARCMRQFLGFTREERDAMGREGRAYVEEHFDERSVIARYLAVAANE